MCDVAALIGDGDSKKAVAATLTDCGYEVECLDSAAILEGGDDRGHGVIVVLAGDAETQLAALIEPLARKLGQLPLVLVCPRPERWDVRAALMAGAAGVVACADVVATLGPCVRAVQAGQACVPREHWRQIEPVALSTREKQILGLVVMGYMNSQIAERLYLAESTVKSHLSSAFGKLGVRSRNEAVDLIVNSERGLGMGILALGGEPLEPTTATVS